MGYTTTYFEHNREIINEKRRAKYDPIQRRNAYNEKRTEILKSLKENKRMCPLCNIMYHGRYLKTHIVKRHGKSDEECKDLML